MQNSIKISCQRHLKHIEDQVRAITLMVDENRYCISVVTEIVSVRAALQRVMDELLRDHVAHCVEQSIMSGDKIEQRRKIKELMLLTTDMTGVWPEVDLPVRHR